MLVAVTRAVSELADRQLDYISDRVEGAEFDAQMNAVSLQYEDYLIARERFEEVARQAART